MLHLLLTLSSCISTAASFLSGSGSGPCRRVLQEIVLLAHGLHHAALLCASLQGSPYKPQTSNALFTLEAKPRSAYLPFSGKRPTPTSSCPSVPTSHFPPKPVVQTRLCFLPRCAALSEEGAALQPCRNTLLQISPSALFCLQGAQQQVGSCCAEATSHDASLQCPACPRPPAIPCPEPGSSRGQDPSFGSVFIQHLAQRGPGLGPRVLDSNANDK